MFSYVYVISLIEEEGQFIIVDPGPSASDICHKFLSDFLLLLPRMCSYQNMPKPEYAHYAFSKKWPHNAFGRSSQRHQR